MFSLHANQTSASFEAVVPIMGLNARLGTLIVDYLAPDVATKTIPETGDAR
jgi:GTP-sensing pleiotropic transcriptional regulator CodY